jgi:Zn-finger nucleic acid-binding protein
MNNQEHEVIQLELKYCERCGGLWLRRVGTGRIYCNLCSVQVADFFIGRRFLTRPRVPGTKPRRRPQGACEVISIRSGGRR